MKTDFVQFLKIQRMPKIEIIIHAYRYDAWVMGAPESQKSPKELIHITKHHLFPKDLLK